MVSLHSFFNTYLDISLGLIGYFHKEFGIGINHMLQNAFINAVEWLRK